MLNPLYSEIPPQIENQINTVPAKLMHYPTITLPPQIFSSSKKIIHSINADPHLLLPNSDKG